MDEVLRRLIIRAFHITNVTFDSKTTVKGNRLTIDKSVLTDICNGEKMISDITAGIYRPGELDLDVNTIMDIIPISTKVLGQLGNGITHTLTGVYCVMTGCDEDGRQVHEFGSSEGTLREHIFFDRAGTPSKTDIILHIDIKLKGGLIFNRDFTFAAFRACDMFLQTIRDVLKANAAEEATEVHEFFDRYQKNPDKKKVVLIKQVAGQGAMYDNQLFSFEPSGLEGGISIINMLNMPILLSPNEYRDGAIRAMT